MEYGTRLTLSLSLSEICVFSISFSPFHPPPPSLLRLRTSKTPPAPGRVRLPLLGLITRPPDLFPHAGLPLLRLNTLEQNSFIHTMHLVFFRYSCSTQDNPVMSPPSAVHLPTHTHTHTHTAGRGAACVRDEFLQRERCYSFCPAGVCTSGFGSGPRFPPVR